MITSPNTSKTKTKRVPLNVVIRAQHRRNVEAQTNLNMEIPKETDPPERSYRPSYPGQYGSLNPMQGMQGNQATQNMEGMNMNMNMKMDLPTPQTPDYPQYTLPAPAPPPTSTALSRETALIHPTTNNLNVTLSPNHAVAIMNLSALRNAITSPRPRTPGPGAEPELEPQRERAKERAREREKEREKERNALVRSRSAEYKEGEFDSQSQCSSRPGVEIESLRTRMLQTVHWSAAEERDSSNEIEVPTSVTQSQSQSQSQPQSPIMRMKNVALFVDKYDE